MSVYMLDTTALIDFSKGVEPTTSRIDGLLADGAAMGICAINVTEFYSGVLPGRRPEWDAFVRALEFWDISYETALLAGRLRHDFARSGMQMSSADMMIASVALEQGATLLTDNARHFPIDGLNVESPRG